MTVRAVRAVRAGLVGSALLVAVAGESCSIRIGSGGPSGVDGGNLEGASACSRAGAETKLPFGLGSTSFAFTWDTDHYVLVYSDPSTGAGDIYVVKLAPNGAVLGAPVVVESTPASSDLPSILKTPVGFLVVWQEGSAGKAVVMHPLGFDATPTGNGTTIASTQSDQSRPVLAQAPGGRAAITWMDTLDGKGAVEVAVVDPVTLKLAGPQRIAQDDIDGWPWIAGDDAVLAVVWSDKASGPYDIHFASIDPHTLAPSPPVSLRGTAANDALLPRVARTSSGFLAAWEDMRGSDNQIYMTLIDTSAERLGGGLVEEPNSGDANWPNIAWNGGAAGIVYYQWRDNRPQVFMSFVDGRGVRVDGLHDLQVSNGSSGWSRYPDVVWTGTEFGVIFVDTRDGQPALWLQRVACPR